MNEKIYFSKIEYREYYLLNLNESFRLVVDLPNRELIYQEFGRKRNMPSATGIETEEWNGHIYNSDISFPMKKIRNGKTDFHPIMIRDDKEEQIITFLYGIKLTDDDYQELLPYCNALDFEPYRNREMSMKDPGYIGYRDEIQMYFSAITDSYIPKLDLPMNYYYDEAHIWPSEKLYRYLVNKYFANNKQLRNRRIALYGGFSLFC